MTINNAAEFVSNLWDWGILRGCFGETKIEPTDVDGLIERNGRFLLLETKSPGVPLKDGQLRAFEALLKTGVFTVFVVWGKPGTPVMMQIFTEVDRTRPFPCGLEELREWTGYWFVCVDRDEPKPITLPH